MTLPIKTQVCADNSSLRERILEELKKYAWSHYAVDEPKLNGSRPIPRCDKYSPYALTLNAVWLRNVDDVLKAVLSAGSSTKEE